MKLGLLSMAAASASLAAAASTCGKRVIIETDFYAFSDDPNAIAMANIFDDWGMLDLIGICSSVHSEYVPAALKAFTYYYGNKDVPVAIQTPLNDSTGDWEYDTYPDYVIPLVEHFPPHNTTFWNPVTLYRKLLSESPDNSVTIAMIGFMDNLYDLFQSEGDEYSSLNGIDLVKAKVSEMIVQGDPDGSSYNLDHVNGTYAQVVLEKFPSLVTFVPSIIGHSTYMGGELVTDLDPNTNPTAFTWNITVGKGLTYESWDETAMLYVGLGIGNWYVFNSSTEELNVLKNGTTDMVKSGGSSTEYRWVQISPNSSNVTLAAIMQDVLLWTPGESVPANFTSYVTCSSNTSSNSTSNTTYTATATPSSTSTIEAASGALRALTPQSKYAVSLSAVVVALGLLVAM